MQGELWNQYTDPIEDKMNQVTYTHDRLTPANQPYAHATPLHLPPANWP